MNVNEIKHDYLYKNDFTNKSMQCKNECKNELMSINPTQMFM